MQNKNNYTNFCYVARNPSLNLSPERGETLGARIYLTMKVLKALPFQGRVGRGFYAIPDRNFVGGYRWGFNGKEQDPETYGTGNIYDYGFRIYNPRIAKFLSVDPLFRSYPWYTPYQFAGNMPIENIDLDGLEEFSVHYNTIATSRGKPTVVSIDYKYIMPAKRNKVHQESGSFFEESDRSNIVNPLFNYDDRFFKRLDHKDKRFNTNPNSKFYATVKSEFLKSQNSSKTGTAFIHHQKTIYFQPDEGNTIAEVDKVYDKLNDPDKDQIDAMVAILISDPNARIDIVGRASTAPTNIDGTKPDISLPNNIELAQQRAQAMFDFLEQYAKENYNGADISGQLNMTSVVPNLNTPSNVKDEDRSTTMTLTR